MVYEYLLEKQPNHNTCTMQDRTSQKQIKLKNWDEVVTSFTLFARCPTLGLPFIEGFKTLFLWIFSKSKI